MSGGTLFAIWAAGARGLYHRRQGHKSSKSNCTVASAVLSWLLPARVNGEFRCWCLLRPTCFLLTSDKATRRIDLSVDKYVRSL